MPEIKQQSVPKHLTKTFKQQAVSHQKSPEITGSYDFAIDTGTARIILKFGRAFWKDNSSNNIVRYLQNRQTAISKAISANKNKTLQMG